MRENGKDEEEKGGKRENEKRNEDRREQAMVNPSKHTNLEGKYNRVSFQANRYISADSLCRPKTAEEPSRRAKG